MLTTVVNLCWVGPRPLSLFGNPSSLLSEKSSSSVNNSNRNRNTATLAARAQAQLQFQALFASPSLVRIRLGQHPHPHPRHLHLPTRCRGQHTHPHPPLFAMASSRQMTPMEQGEASDSPAGAVITQAAHVATGSSSSPASKVTKLELGSASVTNIFEESEAKEKWATCNVRAEYDPEVFMCSRQINGFLRCV